VCVLKLEVEIGGGEGGLSPPTFDGG